MKPVNRWLFDRLYDTMSNVLYKDVGYPARYRVECQVEMPVWEVLNRGVRFEIMSDVDNTSTNNKGV